MNSVKIKIRGTSPLLMHSDRLSNPLDPLTKEIKTYTGKRKKTDDDFTEIARLEWVGGLYHDEKTGPYLPARNVKAMLIQAASRTEGILQDPAPRVYQTALSDFYPEYRLVCQAVPTQPQSRAEVLAMLHAHIQDVFNEHGVQIMSPHYILDPADEKVVPPSRWYVAPAQSPSSPQPCPDDLKN